MLATHKLLTLRRIQRVAGILWPVWATAALLIYKNIYLHTYMYILVCMCMFACKYVATYFCSNEEVKSCIDHAMRTPTRSHTHTHAKR